MGGKPPALFTRRSMRPNSPIVTSTRCSSCARSVTSHETPSARRPIARAASAVAPNSFSVRAAHTTCAPISAKARAIPRPIPRPAPVTTAILSVRRNRSRRPMPRRSREARHKSRVPRFGRVRPRHPNGARVRQSCRPGGPKPRRQQAWRLLGRAASGCRLFFQQGEGVGAALQDEAKALVISRLRAVLRLGIGTVALSILIDLQLARPGLAALLAFKVVAMAAYGGAGGGVGVVGVG